VSRGALCAQIYQASSWTATLSITGIGGSQTVTVASSSTRFTGASFLTDLETAINAAATILGGDTFSVNASFGESGTGKVTIAYDGSPTNFALTWVSTDMRDLLGYTGNLSGAATYTGTYNARGVWLPDCDMAAKYGPSDAGHTETDMGQTISPRGDVHTMVYTSRVRNEVTWSHVSRAKARIQGETTTHASFERFWRDTQGGELGYFEAGAAVRLIWDADTAGTYTEYRIVDRNGTQMERVVEDWSGLWRIPMSLVKVPS
jgi:hypothetical protein